MVKVKICLLGILLLLTMPASAIRVVYNGGGYAEMVVLNAYNMLPKIMKVYAPSELSSGEISLIKLAQDESAFNHLKVDFFNEENTTEIVRYPAFDHIRISSRSLYDANGKSLSLGQLWALSFSAWAQSPHLKKIKADHGISRANIQSLSQRLIDEMNGKINYQTVTINRPSVEVHIISYLFLGKALQPSMFVELPAGTADITENLQASLLCGNSEPGQLQSLKANPVVENAMTAKIAWICGAQQLQGEMMLHFPEDLTLENAKDNLRIQIHSISKVNWTDPCLEALE